MKICFIVGAFPNMKCGVGDYTYMLGTELSSLNNEVSIITSVSAKNDNKSIKVFNIIERWDFSSKDLIVNTLRNIKPDVVHIQYPSDNYGKSLFINFLPRIIKKEIGCKVVETVHEYISYTAKGKLRNLVNYKYADNVIVVEKRYDKMIKSFLKPISKNLNINYIPISSNIPKSKISEVEKNELKKKLDLQNFRLISYFGFVNELKGMEFLIEAFNDICKKDDNIRLLILSELSKENEYQKKIIDMIEHYDLNDKILITGFINSSDEVSKYLKITDLSILPFRDGVSERNGSFLAAYNQGLPIITTSNNIEELDGVYYVEPKNKDAVVKKYFEIKDDLKFFDRDIVSWKDIVNSHINIYKQGE
ncbi:glycosyltransferase [Clostridium perfringens]|uniref:glycosyltransferase n=1 Tax=Clostridium perfringens TaxID=1502 RepID=UPI0034A1C7A8